MPKVKIELEKGMTPDQAEEMLFKAFEAQRNGDMHTEEFSDPAMQDVLARMEKLHKDSYDLMIQEIIAALEGEYKKDGNF